MIFAKLDHAQKGHLFIIPKIVKIVRIKSILTWNTDFRFNTPSTLIQVYKFHILGIIYGFPYIRPMRGLEIGQEGSHFSVS